MRQLALAILGLILLAIGAQGVIRLVISHDPGALRHLPGGFMVQLVVYGAIALFGLTMARRNRVHPDPEENARAHRYR
jgi:ABC-type Na+ efflux pump permease subunit